MVVEIVKLETGGKGLLYLSAANTWQLSMLVIAICMHVTAIQRHIFMYMSASVCSNSTSQWTRYSSVHCSSQSLSMVLKSQCWPCKSHRKPAKNIYPAVQTVSVKKPWGDAVVVYSLLLLAPMSHFRLPLRKTCSTTNYHLFILDHTITIHELFPFVFSTNLTSFHQ